jgi:predicted RNA-binding protein associated with RNAse of E/G family
MAKENRTITGTVRFGGKTFGPDADPDELASALNADQITRLTEKGVISGFDAKADKAVAEEDEVSAEAEADASKAKPKAKK